VNESAPHRLNPFLADLAQAMRSSAMTAREESIERCRQEAAAYVESVKARMSDETAAFHSAADADVATIQERSKQQADRVRTETEERIAKRREHLKQELEEYKAAVESEAQRVQERVVAYQDELTKFFEQLFQSDADPTVFANMAAYMPSPPNFEGGPETQQPPPQIPQRQTAGSNGTAPAVAPAEAAAAAAASASLPPAQRAPLPPGRLSGAGAVRGRLVTEWYPEVERLKAIGDEASAVDLLLDMVTGTEAESQSDGSYVASRPYEELALIYRGFADAGAEYSILERFSRQEHAPGPGSQRLLERMSALKKSVKR
jgi:hypothetical protein